MVRPLFNRQMRCLQGHTVQLSLRDATPVTGIVEEVHLHCLVIRDRRGHRHYCPTECVLGYSDGTEFFRFPIQQDAA
jgi:hypothetical protein